MRLTAGGAAHALLGAPEMCHSEEDLRRYLNEELDEDDRAAIEAHLEDCSQCLEALRAMEEAGAGEFAVEVRRIPQVPQASSTDRTTNVPWTVAEGPGTPIGPYKLLEKLGEGGMGVVYKAEQTQQISREVALKIIKPGMDTKQVIARFNAERQALAMMEHDNIAKVYDAGTTDSGRPYFVMELVKGSAITKHCDKEKLSLKERLELFILVCQAIQHAHQKGIIHRDIKPSNVLVTLKDGKPVPKVIDFGVAKAIDVKLTDMSFTDIGAIVGTPEYMAPEQADPSSINIDIRTDIYSLGVILYELLAGSPPLDAKQFNRGAILEMLRMVREVDPPRPSTKVSTADALPSIAACRDLDPAHLKRALRGDLDWIVMKALEKDRNRRYGNANDFADDVLRHLAHKPVHAAPPSWAYRLRKFVRRHRAALMLAGIFSLFALVMAVRELQVINLRNEKLQLQLKKQDEDLKAQSLGLARESTQGHVAREVGIKLLKKDIKGFDDRIKLAGEDAPRLKKLLIEYRRNLQSIYVINNMFKEAVENLEETKRLIEGWRKESDTVRPDDAFYNAALLDISSGLGWVREKLGQKEEALRAYQEGARLSERIDGRDLPDELVVSRAKFHIAFGCFLEGREKSGKQGEPRESRDQFELGRKILEPSVQDHPASKSYWEELGPLMAIIYGKLGDSRLKDDQPKVAIEDYNREIELWASLNKMTPAVVEKEYNKPFLSLNAGSTRESSGERSDLSQEPATQDLGSSSIWFRLARAHQSRSTAAVMLGLFKEARGDLEFSRKKFRELLEDVPNHFFAKRHQALVERDFGLLFAKAGDLPAAAESLGEAARILRALPKAPTSLAAAVMAGYAGLGLDDQQSPLLELAEIQREMIKIFDRSSRLAAATAAVRSGTQWGAAHPGVLDAGLSVIAMIPPLRIALPGGIDGGTLGNWLGRQAEKVEEILVQNPFFADVVRLRQEAAQARIERAGALRALDSKETEKEIEDAFRDAIAQLERLAATESAAMSPRPADARGGPPGDDAAGGVPPVAILPWLADAHGNLADWHAEHRRFDPAVRAGRWALETWERILRRYPHDLSAIEGKANSHRRLGRILRAAGRIDEAVTSFGEALHVWDALAKDSPHNRGIASGIVTDLSNLGLALLDRGYYDEARKYFDRELSLARWLARQEPGNSAHRLVEARAWSAQADWYHLIGRRDETQSAYDRATKDLEQLAREGVLGDQAQRDLAQCFQFWGNATLQQDNPQGAREIFGRLIDQLKPFAEASGMASDRLSLSNAYGQLGLAWILDKNYAEGIAAFSRAIQEVQGIRDRNDSPMMTDSATARLAHFNDSLEAARLADTGGLDNLGPGPSRPGVAKHLHTWRWFSLIARGDLAGAAQTAETLQGLAPDDPETLALAAQWLARCASAVGGGAAPKDLTDAGRSTRAGYVERAVTVLEQAVLRGYGRANPALLTRDYNFIILREHPRYQSLVEFLSNQGYLTVDKHIDDADRSRKASALGSMAWWHHLMGRQAESRSLYSESIKILKQGVAERSGDTQAIYDLANVWAKLGESAYEERDPPAACVALREGVKLLEPLAADLNQTDARRDLASMYIVLGKSCIDARDFLGAVESLQKGIKILQESTGDKEWLAHANALLVAAQAMSKGHDDINFALTQPLPVSEQLLIRRARACIVRGDLEDASKAIEVLRGLAPKDLQNLLSVAYLFARCASAVGGGAPPEDLNEADRSRRARYVEQAVAILEEAIPLGLGRDGPEVLTQDYDLIVVRSHSRYPKLLEQVLWRRDPGSQSGK